MASSALLSGLGDILINTGATLSNGKINQIRQNSADKRWAKKEATEQARYKEDLKFRDESAELAKKRHDQTVSQQEKQNKMQKEQFEYRKDHDKTMITQKKATELQRLISSQMSSLIEQREELSAGIQSGLIDESQARTKYDALRRQEQFIVEQAVSGNPGLLEHTMYKHWLDQGSPQPTATTPTEPTEPDPGSQIVDVPSKDEMLSFYASNGKPKVQSSHAVPGVNQEESKVSEPRFKSSYSLVSARPTKNQKPAEPEKVALRVEQEKLPEHLQPQSRKARQKIKENPGKRQERQVFNDLKGVKASQFESLLSALDDPQPYLKSKRLSRYQEQKLTPEQKELRELYQAFKNKKETVMKLSQYFQSSADLLAKN